VKAVIKQRHKVSQTARDRGCKTKRKTHSSRDKVSELEGETER